MRRHMCLILVMVLLLLTACGTGQAQQKTTAASAETRTADGAADTVSQTIPNTEAIRPPVDKVVVNPNLSSWCAYYNEFLASLESYDGDYCLVSDAIMYGETRADIDGSEVADGGAYSVEGTFTFGAGSGIENPDLWYVSFSFKNTADPVDIKAHTLCAIAACCNMYESTNQSLCDEQGFQDVFYEMVSALCEGQENIAIEAGDMLFAAKLLGDGTRLILIDSLAFYNAFYAGSIENYFVLE